jgi:hypothetical protein
MTSLTIDDLIDDLEALKQRGEEVAPPRSWCKFGPNYVPAGETQCYCPIVAICINRKVLTPKEMDAAILSDASIDERFEYVYALVSDTYGLFRHDAASLISAYDSAPTLNIGQEKGVIVAPEGATLPMDRVLSKAREIKARYDETSGDQQQPSN